MELAQVAKRVDVFPGWRGRFQVVSERHEVAVRVTDCSTSSGRTAGKPSVFSEAVARTETDSRSIHGDGGDAYRSRATIGWLASL